MGFLHVVQISKVQVAWTVSVPVAVPLLPPVPHSSVVCFAFFMVLILLWKYLFIYFFFLQGPYNEWVFIAFSIMSPFLLQHNSPPPPPALSISPASHLALFQPLGATFWSPLNHVLFSGSPSHAYPHFWNISFPSWFLFTLDALAWVRTPYCVLSGLPSSLGYLDDYYYHPFICPDSSTRCNVGGRGLLSLWWLFQSWKRIWHIDICWTNEWMN